MASRCIIDPPLAPADNMARDEALLLSARTGTRVTLRFYRWSPAALSLGYFQRWGDFAEMAEAGTPVVRRLSGGGAIWHDDEITYSMAGPFGAGPFPGRAAHIFEKLHRCICDGLSRLGVDGRLSDGPSGASPLICFSEPQKYDVVVAGGRKLLGSAQRRSGGAFLQHGSLPLGANRFAPGAASLDALLGRTPAVPEIISALVGAFEDGLGLSFAKGALTSAEEGLARRLACEKYLGDEWTRRR